jgi:hypothetical protein
MRYANAWAGLSLFEGNRECGAHHHDHGVVSISQRKAGDLCFLVLKQELGRGDDVGGIVGVYGGGRGAGKVDGRYEHNICTTTLA